MSHKVHPKILRITETKDWLSRGFYKKKPSRYLEEDFKIRKFLEKELERASIENIEIERGETLVKIIIKTGRPALIIGRGGERIEKLRKGLAKILNKGKKEAPKEDIKIEIVSIKDPWSSAALASQWIAFQLEKRVPYRRTLKMALSKIMFSKEVKGARVQASGRLDGVAFARTEWLQEGELPRQRLRAIIDYGSSRAYCTYGVTGVKVWIYKGEKSE